MHLQDFLAANRFGDDYTRNGIDRKTRELLAFAGLISPGGCEPQVKGQMTVWRGVRAAGTPDTGPLLEEEPFILLANRGAVL
jgi:hypothetical protein